MSDYDMSIHSSTDAREWTDFFFKTYPDCNVSDDVIHGWFANAMMAMHDNQEKLTPRQGLNEYKKGYARAEQHLKREPLSDETIAELWGEEYSGKTDMVKNFARAIEKAHGIGVDDE